MAKVLSGSEVNDFIKNSLIRLFQSGNINFIFGSGASVPAIGAAGNIEKEIQELLIKNEDEAQNKIGDFLKSFEKSCDFLVKGPPKQKNTEDEKIAAVLNNYIRFLSITNNLLAERKDNIHPKRANIFSTNYDLFIEAASENTPSVIVNDGFERRLNLQKKYRYSSKNFFSSLYNTGNLYGYKVEIPSINLIKIHGSLSWRKENDDIIFGLPYQDPPVDGDSIKNYNSRFFLVLPQKGKFRETILDRTYYDLLRIYANEMDKENTALVSFGFSFEDEHIRDVTLRALKNPTLLLLIFAYQVSDVPSYSEKFKDHNNVVILSPSENSKFDFPTFNKTLEEISHLVRQGAPE